MISEIEGFVSGAVVIGSEKVQAYFEPKFEVLLELGKLVMDSESNLLRQSYLDLEGQSEATHSLQAVIDLNGRNSPSCTDVLAARLFMEGNRKKEGQIIEPTEACPFGLVVLPVSKMALIYSPKGCSQEEIEAHIGALGTSVLDLAALAEM